MFIVLDNIAISRDYIIICIQSEPRRSDSFIQLLRLNMSDPRDIILIYTGHVLLLYILLNSTYN